MNDEDFKEFLKTVKKLKPKPINYNLPEIDKDKFSEPVFIIPDIKQFISKKKQENTKTNDMSDLTEYKIKQGLKKGNIQIESKIDLHGYAVQKAYDILYDFIVNSFYENKRLLLVITGKGNIEHPSKIKSEIKNWLNSLNFSPFIKNYFIAPLNYGGEGAFIIILKKLN